MALSKKSANIITIAAIVVIALCVTAILLITLLPKSQNQSEEGLVFGYETRGGKVFITSYTEKEENGEAVNKEITIPAKIDGQPVYGIAEKTFKSCLFTSVNIPEGIVVVEQGAFNVCKKLQKVSIPSTAEEIEGAFKFCQELSEISYSGDRYAIRDGMVYTSDGKTIVYVLPAATASNKDLVISEDVKKIAAYAFSYSDFTSVTLPTGLVEIGEEAFYACKDMTSLEINCPDLQIGTFAFGYCTELKTLNITKVYSIGEDAFRKCTKLKTVEVNSVEYIGDGAFRMCPEIVSAYVKGNYNYIPAMMFNGCVMLEDCMLEGDFSSDRKNTFDTNRINAINADAFSGCAALPAPIIPDGIDYIGSYAFSQCSFTNVYIPEGITYLGAMAFYEDEYLTSVSLPGTLKTIEFQVFGYCNNLKSITIPSSVEELGIMAFFSCNRLSEVTLEEGGCKTMGVLCFGSCPLISVLRLPQSFTTVKAIDDTFFTSDIKETLTYDFTIQTEGISYAKYEVYLYSYGYAFAKENNVNYSVLNNTASIFTVSEKDGGVEITGVKSEFADYLSNSSKLVIPDTINGKSVTSIADRALSGFSDAESIVIPESVKSLSDKAFSGMASLKNIILKGTDPDSVSMTAELLSGHSDITFYVHAAYYDVYQSALKALFGDKISVVNDPDSMFTFAEYSKGYRVVSMISGVDFSGVTSVTIPEAYNGRPVLAISQGALSGATGATDIYVPSSVTRIYDGAFDGCAALQFVHLSVDANVITVGSGLLNGTDGVKICVPEQYSANYLANYDWQGFSIKSE